MMVTPQDINDWITSGLDDDQAHVEVEGDGSHFFATIVTKSFDGKSRIQRHQTIYHILGSKMDSQIHALSMKTFTPIEWQDSN